MNVSAFLGNAAHMAWLLFPALASAQTPATPAPQQITAPIPLAGQPASVAGSATQLRGFGEVLQGAREIPGHFKIHRNDEKVWIELLPTQFERSFFFSMSIPRSVGERGLYGGQMVTRFNSQFTGSHIAEWRRIGNQVQLIARNTRAFAPQGTPEARVVEESFSESLLASAPIASQPNAATNAVLVEGSTLLFADLPGYSTSLEKAFRMAFTLDLRNTGFVRIDNSEELTTFQVRAHFAVPKLLPPATSPSQAPSPAPPLYTPDPRSLFVSFQYNFMKLSETPMRPRAADPRLGHYVTSRFDLSDDTSIKPRTYTISRWRLEKSDPEVALSRPKQPIVYWIDRNVPEKYRKSVSDGILEWNKAFARIGFKDAIEVKQQADNDAFDTMDSRHASVRWFGGADVDFAVGPSHIDPRTGEILDANVGMSDFFSRRARLTAVEGLSTAAADASTYHAHSANAGLLACNYMHHAASEIAFALDLLDARGLDMSAPEAEAIAQAYVKSIIMHEVGHTLGLRHNFRASTVYSAQQLANTDFTRTFGLAGSVMDYMPINLAVSGETQGEYAMSTLGPYDYWAIEYAYKPIEPSSEQGELARIASRSTDPLLAFATDEDAGVGVVVGIDPDANRFDLGADPLGYYRKRTRLSRELWGRLQTMKVAQGESYERLTRGLLAGFAEVTRIAPLATKYVGGVRHVRHFAGSERPIYEPIPLKRQREALELIASDIFHVDSFAFRPEFVSRLAIDHFARPINSHVSIAGAVLNLQKVVLDQLLSDQVAARILDSQEKIADLNSGLTLPDFYDALQEAIWSELKTGRRITAMRRNLQREYLSRVVDILVKKRTAASPADARSLLREDAIEIQARIRAALARGGQSKETRAHLRESLDTIGYALSAQMQRNP